MSAAKICKHCKTPITTSGGKSFYEHVLTPGRICPKSLITALLKGKVYTAEPRD